MIEPFSPPTSPPAGGAAPLHAPPLSVPMRHFLFSAAAFWVFSFALALKSHQLLGFGFDAKWALGWVHTLTLGWITMTILGVLAQMSTVLLDVPLHSVRLIRWAWGGLALGILGFVGHLWAHAEVYWVPAVLAGSAAFLYLYVFARTLLSARKLDWTGLHFALGMAYFALVCVLGMLLAYDQQRGILFTDPEGALIAHVHLALVGWVSIIIFGASYRLVSMFALSHARGTAAGRVALLLVNLGLIGLTLDALFGGRKWMPLWAGLLTAGYLAYVWQMRGIFAARNKKLDPSLSFTLLALVGGLSWAALGLGLACGWIEDTTEARAAYLLAALIGWVTPYILGQIYKIVPFLAWLKLFDPKAWRPGAKVLRVQDLSSQTLGWLQLAAWVPGIVFGIWGFLAESEPLLRTSGICLLATATLYAANFGLTLKHLARGKRA